MKPFDSSAPLQGQYRLLHPRNVGRFHFISEFSIPSKVKSKLNQVAFFKLFWPTYSCQAGWRRLALTGVRTYRASRPYRTKPKKDWIAQLCENIRYFPISLAKRPFPIDKFHLHADKQRRKRSPTHAWLVLISLKSFGREDIKNHTNTPNNFPTFHALNGRNTNTIKSWPFMCFWHL